MRNEVAQFHSFMIKHPSVSTDLQANPQLVNDRKYLDKHEEVKKFLKKHPDVQKEIAEHPRRVFGRYYIDDRREYSDNRPEHRWDYRFHDRWLDRDHRDDHDSSDTAIVESDRKGPPPWAPAHGWRRQHETYYYYPASQVYYYPSIHRYYWLEGREWRDGDRLPRHYIVQDNKKVTLDLDYEPHTQHAKIRAMYPPDYYEHR